MASLKENFLNSLTSGIGEIYDHFNKKIDELQQEVNVQNGTISELSQKYELLEDKYNLLQMEFDEFKKVSMVKNLSNQLHEKNLEIELLNKKLKNMKVKPEPEVEPEVEPEPEPEVEPDPEPEPEPEPEVDPEEA